MKKRKNVQLKLAKIDPVVETLLDRLRAAKQAYAATVDQILDEYLADIGERFGQ